MDVNRLFQIAYRKLKSYAYYDKSQIILASKIAEFEGKNGANIDEKIKELSAQFTHPDKCEELLSECLNSISVLTFPKKIDKDSQGDIIRNLSPKNTKIIDYQYMINMSVEAHILSVVWILIYGTAFDKTLYENAYANRIKDFFLVPDSHEPTFSPNLFQPYFKQYEAWRNSGLYYAKQLHSENRNVIIFSLDLNSFYYSIDFSTLRDEYFRIQPEKSKIKLSITAIRTIATYIYNVLEKYSSLFNFTPESEKSRIMLPIGFLPSNILSNWYLRDFDFSIVNKINPLYYGRYVDDILIVDTISTESKLFLEIDSKKPSEIINYYFCKCKSDNKNVCNLGVLKEIPNNEPDSNKKDSSEFCVNDSRYETLKISPKKIKIFFLDKAGSASLIDNFIEEISRNISIFNYMVDDNLVASDINDKVKRIEYSGSVNILRSIKHMDLDKYEFSKYLAKLSIWGRLVDDPSETKLANSLFSILDNNTIIEIFLFWERVFEYFTFNDRLDYLEKFAILIITALKNTIPDNTTQSFKSKSDTLLNTLLLHMYSILSRVLSLYWSKQVKQICIKIKKSLRKGWLSYDYEDIRNQRIYFIRSRMCKQSLLPQFIDSYQSLKKCASEIDINEINFSSHDSFLNLPINPFNSKRIVNENYKYYPYTLQYKDILWWQFNSNLNSDNPYIVYDDSYKLFLHLNYGIWNSTKTGSSSTKTGSSKSTPPIYNGDYYITDKTVEKFKTSFSTEINLGKKGILYPLNSAHYNTLKIAVANVDVSEHQIIKNLKGYPVRTAERWKTLSSVVNDAIKHKADMLILPECFLPISWLPTLMFISQKNNMAIISGIEHFITNATEATKQKAYNFTATILPHKVDTKNSCTLFIHNKVHFAPDEKRLISGYDIEIQEGEMYPLFIWNGIWFSVYCCYELADICDRALFKSYSDLMIAVEWNKDTNYYSNIIESLSRDMHCFCVQVNSSGYGDSRITQPSSTATKDILKVKGGENSTVLIGELDINALREFQIMNYELQKDSSRFKPTPPNFELDVIKKKISFSKSLF